VNLKYCQLLLFAVGRMHSSEPVPKTKGFSLLEGLGLLMGCFCFQCFSRAYL